jgi:DNA-binding transcriptional regulator YiaG
MQSSSSIVSGSHHPDRLDSAFLASLNTTGTIEISGRRYVTPNNLAATLGVTVRTLCRWDAARIGPRKIKVGKLILYDLAKLPDWLATRESEPVRAAGRRR